MKQEIYSMDQAAKMCGMGKIKFFALLRELGVLTKDNLPYIQYREKGYLKIHVSKWIHPVRGEMARSKAQVTPSGIIFLNELIQQKISHDSKEYKKCV